MKLLKFTRHTYLTMEASEALHSLQRIRADGVEKPPTNKNHPRLYSHNLCPFAARARYALAANGIQFQECSCDLNEKRQWHLDINNGFVPILELPDGTMIRESGIVADYAIDLTRGQGIELVPSDPVLAAKMRLKINDLKMGQIFAIYLSRGKDTEKLETYKKDALVQFESWAKEAGDKWLMGTDEITLADTMIGPMWEVMYMMEHQYSDVSEYLDVKTNAPNWLKYVEKFRAHPALKEQRFRQKAAVAHGVRTRGWKEGEKCQLSFEVLEGAFEEQ